MSSSVSHYGIQKAIQKFENYKKNGAVMKKKYLNKEITKDKFRNWIQSSKNYYIDISLTINIEYIFNIKNLILLL